MIVKTCQRCGRLFRPANDLRKYCSNACRQARYYDIGRRMLTTRRKRLFCVRCGVRHRSDRCLSHGHNVVRRFGSLGPNREYIPPPGVSVRVMQIPYNLHSDRLSQILKELDG